MNIVKEDKVELNIIRVNEVVTNNTHLLIFDDVQEFLKLVVLDAVIYVDKDGDAIQIQESVSLMLIGGEGKLEKISSE